jgi:hypothetical protein
MTAVNIPQAGSESRYMKEIGACPVAMDGATIAAIPTRKGGRTMSYPIMLLFVTLIAGGPDRGTDIECEEIKQKIRMIQSRMRSGYTRAEGEKLEAALRRLRALRSKACR